MNRQALLAEIMCLPKEERLKLAQEVLDSLIDDEDWVPTKAQLAEIRRRLEEHRRDPSTAIPMEEALARLRSRFG